MSAGTRTRDDVAGRQRRRRRRQRRERPGQRRREAAAGAAVALQAGAARQEAAVAGEQDDDRRIVEERPAADEGGVAQVGLQHVHRQAARSRSSASIAAPTACSVRVLTKIEIATRTTNRPTAMPTISSTSVMPRAARAIGERRRRALMAAR